MSVDDLAAEMKLARQTFVAFNDTLVKPLAKEVLAQHAKLLAATHFARDVW